MFLLIPFSLYDLKDKKGLVSAKFSISQYITSIIFKLAIKERVFWQLLKEKEFWQTVRNGEVLNYQL
jgi:hypothetical protein